MFIKEIIIDGFKSYAHRTVIDGFDPHFNAITGLNGSGKSNILDSICFVLGITNLSQVRAGNLSELVYKQGQAGVNKATVTIVFSNQDEHNSPVGYEQCSEVTVTRQVLLGGKSKYLINGRNAPAAQVQNLFHSVQLNVNNPHFLIMQGRITKVLNMKPYEILSMVEEAAGTRMYETKRVAALKTIDKKQLKLDELNSILSEEITPTLERLRGEKESYLKWSKNNADMERMERFVVASEYMKAKSALDGNSEDSAELEAQVVDLEQKATDYKAKIKEKEVEIEERTLQLQGDFEDSHKQAKRAEEKHSKELVKTSSAWQNCKSDVQKAESDLQAALATVQETQAAVAGKETDIALELQAATQTAQNAKEAELKLAQLTLDYQNLSAGISSSQGDEGRTLPQQIAKAHSDSKTAAAKVQQAKLKMAHLSKELKSVEKEIDKEGRSAEKLANKQDSCKAKVAQLKEKIQQLNFSEDEFENLEQEKRELESAVVDLSERVDALNAQLSARLSFKYKDPVRGFDRSKVKGLVAKLIQVRDSKNATALEVVSGGKLFQVVVDEAITGKALLDRGQLERRVTIIPLDKIKPRRISRTTADQATSIASLFNSNAQPAIELVGFDEEVRSAVEYVFGSTIVVDGMKAANQICDITKTRTVTLEGDVYDPSGTISGGSKNELGSTLCSLSELASASQELDDKRVRLGSVSQNVAASTATASKYEKLSAQLQLAETELKATEKHLSQTNYGILVEKRDSMAKEHKEAQQECIEMEKEKEEKWALYEELKDQEIELTQKREDRIAGLEGAVKAAKVDAAEKAKLAREVDSRSQTLSLELESLKSEVLSSEANVRLAEKAVNDATNEEAEVQMKLGEIRALYEDAKRELDSLEERMSHCSAELVGLKNQRSAMVKAAETAKLEAKKLSVTISRIRKERATAEKAVSSLLKKYPWIESEKNAFGVRGGDYDFEANNSGEASKHLKELKAEQESLAKKINKKVMGMIEKAEGEYTELLRKRKVVENDKKKIQAVIEELDVKKKSELERTWVKVNGDFGSIFSTLLPGAAAKLEPPEGMEAWEGLEVKVAFGDVWKESLSELSGGQRSLLALSLILSLLLFKPAPMYILDEVDAALDLSHTQNIGSMLKTHFSQSQFIVVSLKEGMFNNANVIYRTKFIDGLSTVTRTRGNGSSRAAPTLSTTNISDDSSSTNKNGGKSNKTKGKENATAAY